MKDKEIYRLPAVPEREAIEGIARRIPEADPASVETYLHLLKTASDFLTVLDCHFAKYNLSRGRFMVLMTLYTKEDTVFTPADIADRMGVSRATITGLLDGLEKETLVERRPFPGDRRKIGIHLTPRARKFLDGIMPDHYGRVTELMSALSEKDQKSLRRLLGKVQGSLEQMQKPESE